MTTHPLDSLDSGRLAFPADASDRTGRRLVLVVTPGGRGERGGIGRLVTSFTRHWDEAGGGPDYRIVDTYGLRGLAFAPLHFALALARIAWYGARGRAALLHVHMATWGSVVRKGLAMRLGASLGVPILLHLHGRDLDIYYRRLTLDRRRRFRDLLRLADRIIVLGDYWRDVLVDEIGVEAARVAILTNAVAGPRPGETAPPRPAGDAARLLFLGRLEPEKGMPELVRALADPGLAGLAWRARAAGAGDIAGYRRQADELGIPPERLEMPGWSSEAQVRAWLAASDIFVLPSHHEGLSMAVLEAMAFSLAIVTTPVGATRQAIVDGETGLLVPPGDTAALAEALRRVIADPALRRRLGENARARFAERFGIDAYCGRLAAEYDAAIRQAAARRHGTA